METLYSPQSRAERLIAAGRLVLATSSLFAVWLDPTEPRKQAGVAYSLLVAYVVYAAALAVATWRARGPGVRAPLLTHVLDFCFFALFVYFTAGPASPFTTYFVFSMICATLRWRWRGALWTALASIGAYLLIAFFVAAAPQAAHVEPYQIVVRVVYLAVIAVLLGNLGAHEERTRREISALAGWPQLVGRRLEPAVHALLAQAAAVLEAPQALLVWTEGEEPWQYFARWRDGELAWSREAPPGSGEPLLAAELAETSFLCPEGRRPASVLVRSAQELRRWTGTPLGESLQRRVGDGPVLGLRLRSTSFEGHLLLVGKRGMSSDDLLLGEAVAALLVARLESLYLTRDLAERAATDERLRLARDLHDGVLQSLAGVGLRLETVRRMVGGDAVEPAAAAARVEELQRVIALEQRDLRFFIQELEPSRPTGTGQPPPLQAQVGELAQRLELEWGLDVKLRLDGMNGEIPERLTREIYLIAREAMVNAARHGKATAVEAEISAEGGPISIVVADNGCGFPFEGRFSHERLERDGLGPRTLRERVAALAGSLDLESSPAGARLRIRLPVEARDAALPAGVPA